MCNKYFFEYVHISALQHASTTLPSCAFSKICKYIFVMYLLNQASTLVVSRDKE